MTRRAGASSSALGVNARFMLKIPGATLCASLKRELSIREGTSHRGRGARPLTLLSTVEGKQRATDWLDQFEKRL